MRFRRTLALLAGLAFFASSCNLPFGLGPLVNPEVVPTLVQQTMQALEAEAYSPTPTSTPLPTATSTPTTTPIPSSLTLSTPTWCYSGPGTTYSRVVNVAPGTSVPVVGQDPADNFWIIEVPGNPEATCWLSGQNAQLTGDATALPQFPTPPPSLYTLSEPKNLHISCSSSSSNWNVELGWTNTEPSQLGVRIYRNGRLIATLRSGARSFSDKFVHKGKGAATYGVQAYGATAVSGIVTIDVKRCG